jgi:hypothetical protein
MKGFKPTGNGPCYVQKFAIGGLATNKPLEGPGFSDFKSGGKVKKDKIDPVSVPASNPDVRYAKKGGKVSKKESSRLKALSDAGKLLRKARGGRVEGESDPMSPADAMTHKKGGLAFLRKPKIGK